jgi:3'(2'), 5'-bisphosphate nucleotidase
MIDELCRIANAAGEVVLWHYRQPANVTLKADCSPVSDADRASHDFLVGALREFAPDIPVISEEATEWPAHDLAAEQYWLVDPLDGTKEFLRGTDEFTVNIALVAAGRPLIGVVVAPALQLTYCAARGSGAWCRQGNQAARRIFTRQPDPHRLAVVASKHHAGPLVAKLLAAVPGAELKSMGSSLKFCLIAEAKADLYLRDVPTMEWDTAAAQCVVEAAGGAILDLAGQPLTYGKPTLRNPSLMTVGDPSFAWQPLLEATSDLCTYGKPVQA